MKHPAIDPVTFMDAPESVVVVLELDLEGLEWILQHLPDGDDFTAQLALLKREVEARIAVAKVYGDDDRHEGVISRERIPATYEGTD